MLAFHLDLDLYHYHDNICKMCRGGTLPLVVGMNMCGEKCRTQAAAAAVEETMGKDDKAHERPSSFLATTVVVIAWYASNILLLLLNKFLLSSTSFRQPVFLTLCHMSACVLMGLVISSSGYMPVARVKSRVQLFKIFFLSIIFCGTIVLGNASLKYLPVSFNQAIGSTTPFFTAIFAFTCQGTRESFITYLALIPM